MSKDYIAISLAVAVHGTLCCIALLFDAVDPVVRAAVIGISSVVFIVLIALIAVRAAAREA